MIEISRYEGEAICIGERITVTVLEVDGDDVLLRIDTMDEYHAGPMESSRVVLSGANMQDQSQWRLD